MSELLNWDFDKKETQVEEEKPTEDIETRIRDRLVSWVIESRFSAILYQYKKIFGENDRLLKEYNTKNEL